MAPYQPEQETRLEPFFASEVWRIVEPELAVLGSGRRGRSIGIVGSVGSGAGGAVQSVLTTARARGLPSVRLGLQAGVAVASYLAEPVRHLLVGFQHQRPGLGLLTEAVETAATYSQTWAPVIWPADGRLPARLAGDLMADTWEMSRHLVTALEMTREPLVIHLAGFHRSGQLGREVLRCFEENRGTSASLVLASGLSGAVLGDSFVAVDMDALTSADVAAFVGPTDDTAASAVLRVCAGSRWMLASLNEDLIANGKQLGWMSPGEVTGELDRFWLHLCDTRFQPIARNLDTTDRRILVAIAHHRDPAPDTPTLIRAVGDTNRFTSDSSFLVDRITALIDQSLLVVDPDGGLHAAVPGLSIFLQRT